VGIWVNVYRMSMAFNCVDPWEQVPPLLLLLLLLLLPLLLLLLSPRMRGPVHPSSHQPLDQRAALQHCHAWSRAQVCGHATYLFLLPLQALGNAVVLGGVALVAFVTWREGSRALTFAASLLSNWCAARMPAVCAIIH
jgi:hypothetical protein